MANSTPKLTPVAASGLSLLGLQSVTAPLVLAALAQSSDVSPRWLVGLYIALELGAMASAVFVAWGMHAKRTPARLAPAMILLPCWVAVAIAGPFVYGGLSSLAFSGFALSMGLLTSVPFVTRSAAALFETDAERAASLTLAAAGK